MSFKIVTTSARSEEFTEVEIILSEESAGKSLNAKTKNRLKELAREEKTALIPVTVKDKVRLLAFCAKQDKNLQLECLRKLGHEAFSFIKTWGGEGVVVVGEVSEDHKLAFTEGFCLSTYSFDKYLSAKKSSKNYQAVVPGANNKSLSLLDHVLQGVIKARDLVNEPPSVMTARKMAASFQEMGKEAGFKTEVLQKKQIEALKLGGILAVNRGSVEPPTFTIMEYKPAKAKNKKPYVLVGKGVSFDSGGLNIKTSSMELMKSDMAGSAAVAGTLYAIAKAKLPVHIIGLVPATDNKTGPDAVAPGDIIKICDGTTVEILNTDAEGRLILADALSYALRYKPELIIDLATLTGAAMRAIGRAGIVAMGNMDEQHKAKLNESGNEVHERLVEFPLWDEYAEMIKSPVADIANLGGPLAGAITAGKFLEHFTKGWNWMHLDIAGPSYLESKDTYRGIGGTGTGVRLLFSFFNKISAEK